MFYSTLKRPTASKIPHNPKATSEYLALGSSSICLFNLAQALGISGGVYLNARLSRTSVPDILSVYEAKLHQLATCCVQTLK